MTRVVIDTNVLVSAVIGRGKPRSVLKTVLKDHTTVSSREAIAELADVLPRAKFSLSQRQINRFLAIYVRNAEIVALRRHVHVVSEDPDDNVVIDTAINGSATLIVTGDKHLLRLKEFESVKIVTAEVALRILRTKPRLSPPNPIPRGLAQHVDVIPRRRRNEPYTWHGTGDD